MIKQLPPLYSSSSHAKLQVWTIEIQGDSIRTTHGKVGGRMVTSKWFRQKAKNIGRSNGTTPEEQALLVAERLWQDRVEGGAKADPDAVTLSKSDYSQPQHDGDCMLATKLEQFKPDAKAKLFPCFVQPKLDGMRAIIRRGEAKSRNNKSWKTIPHIIAALEPVFKKYPNLVFDGELYNHDLHDDFNEISSIVKKTKPTAEDLEKSAKMTQYWVYDVQGVPDLDYSARLELLKEIFGDWNFKAAGLVLVPTFVAQTEEDMKSSQEVFLNSGYEGLMIRIPSSKYEFTRSNNLIKVKTWIDEEFQIQEILEGEGNRSGMASKAIMLLPDGRTFRSSIKGNRAFLIDLLAKKDSYKGKWATIKYFNLTPDGKPRFSNLKAFREGKGIDN